MADRLPPIAPFQIPDAVGLYQQNQQVAAQQRAAAQREQLTQQEITGRQAQLTDQADARTQAGAVKAIFARRGKDLVGAADDLDGIDPEQAAHVRQMAHDADKMRTDWLATHLLSLKGEGDFQAMKVAAGHQGFNVADMPATFADAQSSGWLDKSVADARGFQEKFAEAHPGKNLQKVGANESIIDVNAPAGTPPIFTAPPDPAKAETERHNKAMETIGTMTAGREVAAQQETARHNRATEGIEGAKVSAAAGDKTDLTPTGLDMAALNYKKTGQLPPLGMGDKSTRKVIINRSAELTPEDIARIESGGNDLASNRAGFKANQDSLTGLQKQRDAIGAFEATAMKNIDIFLESAGKVVDTGSPLANSTVRMVSGRMLGSPDQAAYDAARQVAVNEIAKITSNPTLTGTLSDSARHEVDAFNPANATLKQSVAVMRLLKRDMANRTTSLDDAIAGVKGRIGGGTGRTPGITVTAPNGKVYPFPDQAAADRFVAAAKTKGLWQ